MTYLYRIYNQDGELLYVGITDDLGRRLTEHTNKEWWPEASYFLLHEYQSRREALVHEYVAIHDEWPLFDKQHNEAWEGREKYARNLCYECGEPVIGYRNVQRTCLFDVVEAI
jgi:predicted GIY-YIG superfamily endonuclease